MCNFASSCLRRVPSKKDARMGGTLHNVKSVIDALSIGCSEREKFKIIGQGQCRK